MSAIVTSNDETNAAKPQRIDLSQFEGIWDKKHNLSIEKTPTDGCHWTVYFENDVEANMSVSSEFGKEIHEEADRFYHAIDKLPDLIAELKRCYDRIDYLEVVAEEYRQERPEEYCANCYAYLEDYDGDGVMECLCRDCEASE